MTATPAIPPTVESMPHGRGNQTAGAAGAALGRISFGCVYNVDTLFEGQTMEAVIRKWGNSPALRLPVSALKEAEFSLEQKVNIVVTRGRIVIEPSGKVEYDLDELLDGITTRNSHTEVSFGKALGKEVL